jgi:hypothetical protein
VCVCVCVRVWERETGGHTAEAPTPPLGVFFDVHGLDVRAEVDDHERDQDLMHKNTW